MITEQQARQTIPRVLRALEQAYAEPPPNEEGDALEMSVRLILHEDSSEKAVSAAMRRIDLQFVDWNEVRVSTPYQVSRAISATGDAEAKAVQLLALLQAVFRERNEVSLDFLREGSAADARTFLEGIPELGPVLAGKLAMLVFGHPSVVVTPEVARVSLRLDWIREDYDADQILRRLERLVTRSAMRGLYHTFREHARKVCQAQDPKCKRCPVLRHCPFGREATKRSQTASADSKRKKGKSGSKAK